MFELINKDLIKAMMEFVAVIFLSFSIFVFIGMYESGKHKKAGFSSAVPESGESVFVK